MKTQPQRAGGGGGVSEANQGGGVISYLRWKGRWCVCVCVLNVGGVCVCTLKICPEMSPGPRWRLCQSVKAEQEASEMVNVLLTCYRAEERLLS